jgi:hypothetical protein
LFINEKMRKGKFSFLVIGAGRGGTSLLAGLLDYHSQIELGFELFSQEYLMGKAIASPRDDIFNHRVQQFLHACNEKAEFFPDKYWGNKITTEQLYALEEHNEGNPSFRIDILDNFFNVCLSGVKVVFILRDGRTCVRSKMARTGQSLELACQRWRYSVSVFRFLQTRSPETTLCVRYENLIMDSHSEIHRICDFLGVEYEKGMLNGTGNTKMLQEYRQNEIDKSKLTLQEIPDGCVELIYSDLISSGYI